MGHKTHPLGFRLGIIKDWKAHWYSQGATGYSSQVKEDLQIRDIVKNEYKTFSDAGIAKVEIDLFANSSICSTRETILN